MTTGLQKLVRVCLMVTAMYCRADMAPIDLPRAYHAYQPVSIASTPRGFVLAANSIDRAAGGWDISLLEVNSDFKVVAERVLTGNGSNTVQKIIGLDDGLILLGNSTSSAGLLRATEGVQDIVVARLDEQLEILWSMNLGGGGVNQAQDISVSGETVTILGWIDTPGAEIRDYFGGWDIVVARYSGDGRLIWTRTLGGRQDDIAGVLYSEGDWVYAGYNSWSGEKKWDIELVRLDNRGRVRWRKTLGGGGSDLISKLIPTREGLIVLGSTDSQDFVPGARGHVDIFVLELSNRGRIRSAVRFGGTRSDMAADIVIINGKLSILGWSESDDLDIRQHFGGKDLVVFNLADDEEMRSYTFGTLDDDWPLQIISVKDRNFCLGGTKVSERVLQPFWIELK